MTFEENDDLHVPETILPPEVHQLIDQFTEDLGEKPMVLIAFDCPRCHRPGEMAVDPDAIEAAVEHMSHMVDHHIGDLICPPCLN